MHDQLRKSFDEGRAFNQIIVIKLSIAVLAVQPRGPPAGNLSVEVVSAQRLSGHQSGLSGSHQGWKASPYWLEHVSASLGTQDPVLAPCLLVQPLPSLVQPAAITMMSASSVHKLEQVQKMLKFMISGRHFTLQSSPAADGLMRGGSWCAVALIDWRERPGCQCLPDSQIRIHMHPMPSQTSRVCVWLMVARLAAQSKHAPLSEQDAKTTTGQPFEIT